MKITKKQLKKIILEFLDTKSYSETAVSSKFAQDFAKGYEAAFASNGLKPDYDGLEIFEIFKPYFSDYIKKHGGSLKESKEGDPKGGLRHFLKFLAFRERRVPTKAGYQTDYTKVLSDDPKSDELADRWDKVSGDTSAEADLERSEIRSELPRKFHVGDYRPIKAVDAKKPENLTLNRSLAQTIAGDTDFKYLIDDSDMGSSPFEDALFSIFPALIGSIPSSFAAMYMAQILFPSIDAEAVAAGMVFSTAFTLGLLFACSSSSELFKQYKKSLQKAGDKLNTPYGGNIALEEYSAFLDEEFDRRYEEEKEKALAKLEEDLKEVDQHVAKMIETKKETIEEFYRKRQERMGSVSSNKEIIDVTPNQEEDDSWQYGSVDYGEDYDSDDND